MHGFSRAAAAALATFLAGCTAFGVPADFNGVVGSGPIVDEERRVDEPFTAVRAGGGVNVDITQGTPQSVRLSAQANILAILEAEVVDGTLLIDSSENYATARGITATIVVERLDGLELWGGAVGDVRGIAGEEVEFEVSGGAEVTAAGHASDLRVTASSGAVAHLGLLHITDANVECSGGGRIELNATGTVRGEAWGGATVDLSGDPATVDVELSGGSRIE